MSKFKEHIIFKSTIIILVITLLVPSFVKFAHLFEDHEHTACIDFQKEHFHEFDLECEFYQFKLNPQFAVTLFDYELINDQDVYAIAKSQYQFISDYQRLAFSLRGPPSLV